MSKLEQQFKDKLNEVLGQREEILTAFVAKYGYEPDKIVQVCQHLPDGARWWVELKNEDEV